MRLLFACLYKCTSIDKSKSESLILSLCAIGLFMWINVISIIIFLNRLFFGSRFRYFEFSDIFIVISVVVVIIYEYYVFVRNQNYKAIVLRYERSYLRSLFYFIIYILFTIIIFALIALYRYEQ